MSSLLCCVLLVLLWTAHGGKGHHDVEIQRTLKGITRDMGAKVLDSITNRPKSPKSQAVGLQTEDDDYYNIYAFPYSNCYVETPTAYSFGDVNVSTCWENSQDYRFAGGYTDDDGADMPPPCLTNESQLVFDDNGLFSSDQTFYTCLARVYDSAAIPTYYDGSYHGCTFLSIAMTLLNLVSIEELSGSASLQVIVDYSWYDYRYNMPLFWEYADDLAYSGVDLTRMLTNDSVVMWLPEVTFPDAAELSVQSATLAYYTPCRFVYEVVYDLRMIQPLFDFRKYPSDTQQLVIRSTVSNQDATQLQMFPKAITCSHIEDGSCAFSHNAVWTWQPDDNSCTVYYDKRLSLVWPSYAMFTISVTRSSSGVLVRFVVPLTCLIMLSALTFWISYESRVDTTITLLLAISALYIVILQNIPMVGYLTSVDRFVFGMFLLLCCIAAMHQVYATVRNKVDRWPLRPVYLRCIEMVGRCCVPPIVLYYFALTVQFDSSDHGAAVILAAIAVSLAIFSREIFGVRATYIQCMLALVDKVNQPETTAKDLSSPETLALNIWVFKDMSFSKIWISRHLAEHGRISIEVSPDLALRNIFSLNSLLGRPLKSNAKVPAAVADPSKDADSGTAGVRGSLSVEMTSLPATRFSQDLRLSGAVVSNPLQQNAHLVSPTAIVDGFRRTIGMLEDSDDDDDEIPATAAADHSSDSMV